MKNLIFVDCEATGGSPSTGTLTEFGAVDYETRKAFHGILVEAKPLATNRALSVVTGKSFSEAEVFRQFGEWLLKVCKGGRPIFVSDNPAYDWQWINDGFQSSIILLRWSRVTISYPSLSNFCEQSYISLRNVKSSLSFFLNSSRWEVRALSRKSPADR